MTAQFLAMNLFVLSNKIDTPIVNLFVLCNKIDTPIVLDVMTAQFLAMNLFVLSNKIDHQLCWMFSDGSNSLFIACPCQGISVRVWVFNYLFNSLWHLIPIKKGCCICSLFVMPKPCNNKLNAIGNKLHFILILK